MPELKISSKSRAGLFIFLFVVGLFLLLLLSRHVFFVPKILMLCFSLVLAGALGRMKIFVRDWFVFVAFIYLFDSLRGTIYILTCRLNLPVHVQYVISLEKLLFGDIPSVLLQGWLLKSPDPAQFTWLEKFMTVAHGSHFVAFLLCGFVIWFYKPAYFRFFKVSFYLVISLGLLGYLAIPTVPPWMAANIFGLFPRLVRFIAAVYSMSIPDISSGFDTNPIAAMPSLHAAFPVLCGLVLWRVYRWKSLAFFVYVLLMLFTIVYAGEHYIVDIIPGIVLALLCYAAAWQLTKKDFAAAAGPLTPPPDNGRPTDRQLVRALIGGIAGLFIGIAIGTYNRDQFIRNPAAYNLYAPRYEDFFRREGDFRSNYRVQYYLAGHSFLKQDFAGSLKYYEQCLALSRNDEERQRSEAGIKRCRELLGLAPKDP